MHTRGPCALYGRFVSEVWVGAWRFGSIRLWRSSRLFRGEASSTPAKPFWEPSFVPCTSSEEKVLAAKGTWPIVAYKSVL